MGVRITGFPDQMASMLSRLNRNRDRASPRTQRAQAHGFADIALRFRLPAPSRMKIRYSVAIAIHSRIRLARLQAFVRTGAKNANARARMAPIASCRRISDKFRPLFDGVLPEREGARTPEYEKSLR